MYFILLLLKTLIHRLREYFFVKFYPVNMKTCITFFEGYTKRNELEITNDEKIEYKIEKLQEYNEFISDKLFDDYLIYHNPFPFKSNIQNSVFHKYNGNVFVTHKSRDLNEDDLHFFKEYSQKVYKKGKRIYTEPKQKLKNIKITHRKPGVLKIN